MTAGRLEKRPATDESKSVGQSDGAEIGGHASGRRIIKLLHTNRTDLTDDRHPVALLPCELGPRPKELTKPHTPDRTATSAPTGRTPRLPDT
ncbi:DUF3140 domain-containing protein [Streptomyces sp. NPDC057456]|uniref:DUF3140 domain-containing protein n=1 Tax=Streptomyces sp. NPDC057456 TaxID=3346139 RepID=UPI0036B6641B